MKLIDSAGQWHRLWSMRVALAGVVFNACAGGWVLFQGNINPILYASVNMMLAVGVGVTRLLDQTKPDGGSQ